MKRLTLLLANAAVLAYVVLFYLVPMPSPVPHGEPWHRIELLVQGLSPQYWARRWQDTPPQWAIAQRLGLLALDGAILPAPPAWDGSC